MKTILIGNDHVKMHPMHAVGEHYRWQMTARDFDMLKQACLGRADLRLMTDGDPIPVKFDVDKNGNITHDGLSISVY